MNIVVEREEFKRTLANLINGSGLPFFVVAGVMRELLAEVDSLSRKQYEIELAKQKADDNKAEEIYDEVEE